MLKVNVFFNDLDFRINTIEKEVIEKNEFCQCDDDNTGKFHFYKIIWLRKWK